MKQCKVVLLIHYILYQSIKILINCSLQKVNTLPHESLNMIHLGVKELIVTSKQTFLNKKTI